MLLDLILPVLLVITFSLFLHHAFLFCFLHWLLDLEPLDRTENIFVFMRSFWLGEGIQILWNSWKLHQFLRCLHIHSELGSGTNGLDLYLFNTVVIESCNVYQLVRVYTAAFQKSRHYD